MKLRSITSSLIFTVAIALMTLPSVQAHAQDADGCWSGETIYGQSCLVQESARWDGTKLIVVYRNQCERRLYGRFCNQYTDGTWNCGASGVAGGATKTWYTYNANGHSSAIATGSINGTSDWVCAGKVSNWHDEP